MRQRERHASNPEPLRDLFGLAMKLQRRTARRQVGDFEIVPGDTPSPAGSERLHPRFFRGEPRCISFIKIGFSLRVCDFAGGEDAVPEPRAMRCFHGVFQPWYFANVDSSSNNHPAADFLRIEGRLRIQVKIADKIECTSPTVFSVLRCGRPSTSRHCPASLGWRAEPDWRQKTAVFL